MKKSRKFLLVVLASLSITFAKAQVEFDHSLGITALFSQNNGGWGFTYDPRLNFAKLGDNGVLSAGTHLTLGISLSSQNPDGNSLVFDLPLMLEYNSGFGSTKDNDASFGWFGGIGYDVSSVQADDNGTNHSSGVIFNVGVRFGAKVPLSIRASYLLSSASNDPSASNVIGVGISYMFGMRK